MTAGVFWDAVHLTAWQTFYKNLVLVPCCILHFVVQRKNFFLLQIILGDVYISGYSLFIIINSSYSLKHLPSSGLYRFQSQGPTLLPGNAEVSDLKYNTVFIYSKNGKAVKV